MRPTQEWEKALEEATPGPWQVGATTDLGHVYVGAANPDVGGIIAETGHDDARLISLAPEAVAEVVRLRRELEQLRDRYLDETSQPHYSGDYGDGSHCATNSAARDIERILEGNHE